MPVNPYATTTTSNPYARPVPPSVGGQTPTTTTTTTRPVPPSTSGDTYVPSNPYGTSSRPVPPAVNNPYVQNPGSYNRPVPPPVITGGVVTPYRPMPPVVYPNPTQTTVYWPFELPSVPYGYQREFALPPSSNSYEILSNFQTQNARAKDLYNRTSMTQGELQNIQMFLVKESVSELLNNTYSASYQERKNVLDGLYNASPMTQEMRTSIDQELVRRELGRIEFGGGDFSTKKMLLTNLYNASSMTQDQERAAQHQLFDTEANRIIADGQPMYDREIALNNLYQASEMSQGELQNYLEHLHNGF